MPELFLDIKLGLNESARKTVESELSDIQKKANQSLSGGDDGINRRTSAIKKQADAQKLLNDKFVRLKNLNEVRFRQGKISQEQAIRYSNLIEEAAQNQGILNDNTKRGVQFQKQMQLSQQRMSTGFTGMAQQSVRANQSLMNMGRIVQDLPFGFLGISNNIDPALNSFRSLRDEAGGTMGALKMLGGSLMGSGGLIFALGSLLPSAILIAQKGFNMYSKKADEASDSTIKLREESEVLADAVKSGIGSFTDSIDENKIDVLEEALKQFDPEVNGSKFFKADVDAIIEGLRDFNTSFGDDGVRIVQNESGEIVRETVESIQDAISESEEINELVENELKNRLAVAQAEQKILEARSRLNLLRPDEGLLDIEDIDIEIPEFEDPNEEKRNQALIDATKRRAESQIAINEIAFETRLAQASDFEKKRLKLIMNRVKNEQDLVDAGVNREQSRELAYTMWFQENENLKTKILQQATEKRKALQDEVANYRLNVERNVISALQSINKGVLGDNKALAIGILAVEKGLAISEVIVKGTQKAFEATAQGLSLLSNPFTASLAPQAFAMAGKIKALTAINVAAIAAQGFGEAAGIATGGGSGGTGGAGSGRDSRQMGFFESEPQRAMGAQPINITLEGEFDDEMVSVKAQRGSNKRRRGTQFSL